jgi:hypothetical protein
MAASTRCSMLVSSGMPSASWKLVNPYQSPNRWSAACCGFGICSSQSSAACWINRVGLALVRPGPASHAVVVVGLLVRGPAVE